MSFGKGLRQAMESWVRIELYNFDENDTELSKKG